MGGRTGRVEAAGFDLFGEAAFPVLQPPRRFADDRFECEAIQLLADALKHAGDHAATLRALGRFARTTRFASHRVIAKLTFGHVVVAVNRRFGHEHEEFLIQHQTHDFVAQTSIVICDLVAADRVVDPLFEAQCQQFVVQLGHTGRTCRIAQTPIRFDSLSRAIDVEQLVGKAAVVGVLRILQRQLDRLANQVCPTFLRLVEVLVDRRIVADQNACKRFFIEDLGQRGTIFVNTIKQHGELVSQKRPHAIDAPRRFIGVNHRTVGQQRAERIEFTFPASGKLVEQRIGLTLLQVQLLEERQHRAGFVDRQPEMVNLIGDGDEDLDSELAAADQAGGLSEAIAAPINLVGDQNRATVL